MFCDSETSIFKQTYSNKQIDSVFQVVIVYVTSLSGPSKPIDGITFCTQQGFNDINIENIQLTEYICNINKQEINMNNRINTVGFEGIMYAYYIDVIHIQINTYIAIEIIVEPLNPIKQNAISNTENINFDYNIDIILGPLIGILFSLTVIICIYGTRFYFITKRKKKYKKKNKYRNSKHNREGIEGKKDKQNIEIATNDDIIIQQRKQFQPIASVAPSSMTTRTLDILNNNNNYPYLEDKSEGRVSSTTLRYVY